MARLVIAGASSGCGKTTLTSSVAAALRGRGLRVQPYKAGPDYIDPSYHSRAAGVPARNLDSWLVPEAALRELFARAAASADITLIEGMMGLYDGRADTDDGSTAQLAKLLEAPVVLVLDVAQVSRTAAALALGCQRFDPDLQLVGVLLNGVASDYHYQWAAGPIEAATGLPVLGYLPTRADLALPERHLGLVPTAEGRVADDFFERLADQAEQTIDLDRLLALARAATPLPSGQTDLFPPTPVLPQARIALAWDEAFNFYYQDNLDLLRAWGAELVPFSPLRDARLPSDAGGVYIGGGFPELYARELAANRSMHDSVREAATAGLPIYAECGGLMYLCEGIVDFEGAEHPLLGIVPGWSALDRPCLSLGYRTAIARRSTLLLEAGERVRGHEFHWSQLRNGVSGEHAAYELQSPSARPGQVQERRLEGYAQGNVLATYLHVHFGSDPRLAPRLVAACAASVASSPSPGHQPRVPADPFER